MSKGLITLRPRKGFPQDFRHPGLDRSARNFAVGRFGELNVQRVEQAYHRSVVTKEALEADLFLYDRDYVSPVVRDDPVYQMALQSVRTEFIPSEKLIPLTLGAVEQSPNFPKDRSPGLPWKMWGYKTKGDVLKDVEAKSIYHKTWRQAGKGKDVSLPDVALFVRAQVTGIDRDKIRAVWGYPIDVIVEEGRTFYPYLEWVKAQDLPTGYAVEIARGGMAYINEMLDAFPDSKYLINDWSNFDKTIPPWLIRDVFQIIRDSFDFTKVRSSDDKLFPVSEEDSERRFRKIIKYFINTPVRTCDGTRYKKTGGVPSGSMWTNLIDTLVNIVVMRYVGYHTTGSFPQAEMYLGDDSVCVMKGMVDLDLIAALALEKFGMQLNVRKSYVTTEKHNVHFIGYFNRGGRPYKPQDFLIASFIYPERRVETNTIRLARCVGQMWSTMDGAAAANWHDIATDIMDMHGVTEEDMQKHIIDHPSYFKYLRTIGIDLGRISIPPMGPDRFVWRIEPPYSSLKRYRVKVWDYNALWDVVTERANKVVLYSNVLGEWIGKKLADAPG